jgi:hypothetical protein
LSRKTGAKTKGWIKNNDTGKKKSFQFNPSGLQYSRGATYVDVIAPGMAYPDTQFVKGNARSFPIELFLFDKSSSGLIEEYRNFIGAFLPPETNVKNYSRPPSMTFCFGYFIRQCVLEDLSIYDEDFDEDGESVQARFILQLRQVGV